MPRSCCTQLTSLSTDLRGGQGRGVSSVATLAPIGGTADQGKAGWRSSAEPIAGRVRGVASSGTFDRDRALPSRLRRRPWRRRVQQTAGDHQLGDHERRVASSCYVARSDAALHSVTVDPVIDQAPARSTSEAAGKADTSCEAVVVMCREEAARPCTNVVLNSCQRSLRAGRARVCRCLPPENRKP